MGAIVSATGGRSQRQSRRYFRRFRRYADRGKGKRIYGKRLGFHVIPDLLRSNCGGSRPPRRRRGHRYARDSAGRGVASHYGPGDAALDSRRYETLGGSGSGDDFSGRRCDETLGDTPKSIDNTRGLHFRFGSNADRGPNRRSNSNRRRFGQRSQVLPHPVRRMALVN